MTGPKPAKNQELHTEVTKVIKVFLKISALFLLRGQIFDATLLDGLFLIRSENYWSNSRKEPDNVNQVAEQSNGLKHCERDVTASSDQDLRPEVDAGDGGQIEQGQARNEE